MISLNNHSRLSRRHTIWVAVALLLFVLCCLYPPTGDDWNRLVFSNRTVSGYLDLVREQYTTLNGRVIGNLASFVFIEPVWLRGLVKTITMLCMAWCLATWTRLPKKWGTFTALFLILAAPRLIYMQVISWSAGFFNYAPPMIGLFFILMAFRPVLDRKPPESSATKGLFYFFVGWTVCLFVEHVTLFAFLLSMGLVILEIVRFRRPSTHAVSLFIGTLSGTVIMFGSPIYRKILMADDTYREVPKTAGHFIEVLLKNYRAFSRYTLFENVLLLLLVCGVCLLVLTAARRRQRLGKLAMGWFLFLPVAVIVTRTLFRSEFYFTASRMQQLHYIPVAVDLLLYLVTFLMLIVVGQLCLANDSVRRQYFFTLACIPIVSAPLFVVRPVLARNYFVSYLLIVSCLLLLMRPLFRASPRLAKWICTKSSASVVALLLVFTVMTAANHRDYLRRTAAIEAGMARKETIITIPRFTFPWLIFGPGDSSLGHKWYYEKANDIQFHIEGDPLPEPVETTEP